jgi:hypothetical protein
LAIINDKAMLQLKKYLFKFFFVIFLTFFIGCDKKATNTTGNQPFKFQLNLSPYKNPIAFNDNRKPKKFSQPAFTDAVQPSDAATVTISIDGTKTINKVSTYLNGNNSNTFSGQMVDQPVLLNNIRSLNPGIIRYPGGDISDTYFWNEPNGILPAGVPDSVFVSQTNVTSSYFWYGQNTQPWTLSLDNYYLMLQKTGSTGLITVNYGYARYGTGANPVQAAAHLAADWVRYDKGRTKYWEVGNESYGYWEAGWKINKSLNQDGQPETMTGSLYGQHFKVFADSMHKAAAESGSVISIGAQLIAKPTPNSDNPAEADWNSGFFSAAADAADYYVIHNYYTNYGANSDAPTILNSAITETQAIKDYLQQSFTSSARIQKPVAMTEWNIFAVGSDQRVSQIAGVHAVLTLGEMIKANISMATRFDLLGKYTNGDDFATFSIGDEPDNPVQWNPRPVFYYMRLFNTLIGDQLITSTVSGNGDIVCYASKYSAGSAIGAIVVNKGSTDQVVSIAIPGNATLKYYYYYTLQGDQGVEFSRKVYINGQGPAGASGGPANYLSLPAYRSPVSGGIKVKVPTNGVVYIVADVI